MKRIGVALAAVLAIGGLAACKDPHEGEHCVAYVYHTHTHTTGTGKSKHTYTTRDHDCVDWEKDK